jgi:hypothetical protein
MPMGAIRHSISRRFANFPAVAAQYDTADTEIGTDVAPLA